MTILNMQLNRRKAMFPIIPLIGILGVSGGTAILGWYHSLNQKQKDDADAFAEAFIRKRFGLSNPNELNDKQKEELAEALKQRKAPV